MRWINGDVAWEAKSIWVEVSHQLFESGRICHEATCTSMNQVAFEVEFQGHRWHVGFCAGHAVEFAAEHHDIIIGLPRRLKPGAVLHGPLADDGMGDLQDVEDEDGEDP